MKPLLAEIFSENQDFVEVYDIFDRQVESRIASLGRAGQTELGGENEEAAELDAPPGIGIV